MGVFEWEPFRAGTEAVARGIAEATAFTAVAAVIRWRRSVLGLESGRCPAVHWRRRRARVAGGAEAPWSKSARSGSVVRMPEQKSLIVGNWKVNATHLEAIQMVQKLSYRLEARYDRVEVVVAPPFTSLRSVQTVIEADRLWLGLGA